MGSISFRRSQHVAFAWVAIAILAGLGCMAPGGDGPPGEPGPGELCPPVFFQPIGDLPGDAFASASTDISGDGVRAVGQSWADDPSVVGDGSSGYPHGYEAIGWTRNCEKQVFFRCTKFVLPPGKKVSGLIALGYLLPSIHPESNAHGISPDGCVVVGFATAGTDNHIEAVELGPFGPDALQRIATDLSSAARDVSDRNPALVKHLRWPISAVTRHKGLEPRVIVGWSSTSNQHPHFSPGAKAVYWDVFRFPRVLPVPPRLPNGAAIVSSEATSVSSDGTVIAGNLFYDDGTSFIYPSYGATWVFIKGNYILKAVLPGVSSGTQDARVMRISADGKAVVGYCMNAASEPNACVWNAGGGAPSLLPLLPGTTNSAAFGMDPTGSMIVGYCGSYTDAAPWFDHRATIWAGGTVTDLADILKSASPSVAVPSDWEVECRAVSDNGKTIAGWGFHRDPLNAADPEAYTEEGWVARIP